MPAQFPTWFIALFVVAMFASFVLFGYTEARRDRRKTDERPDPVIPPEE